MRKASLRLLLSLLTLAPGPLAAAPSTRPALASALQPNATKRPLSPELAAYQRELSNAPGRRWYHAMTHLVDPPEVGTVKIRFYLLPSGSIKDVKVLSGGEKNPRLARVSEGALRATKFPPMPAKVRADLRQPRGSMEVDFTFTNK